MVAGELALLRRGQAIDNELCLSTVYFWNLPRLIGQRVTRRDGCFQGLLANSFVMTERRRWYLLWHAFFEVFGVVEIHHDLANR
jgi:hypothetical protein